MTDSGVVFYSEYTGDNKYSLFRTENSDAAGEEIISGIEFGMVYREADFERYSFMGGYFTILDEEHICYMTRNGASEDTYYESISTDYESVDLYMIEYGSEPELLIKRLIPIEGDPADKTLAYILEDDIYTINLYAELIDTSNSRHNEAEITSLLDQIKEEGSIEYKPLYCYDFDNKRVVCICNLYGEYSVYEYEYLIDYNGGIFGCLYLEPMDFLENYEKIPVDMILDDERYDEEDAGAIMDEYMEQQIPDMENIVYPWKGLFINARTGDICNSMDLDIGEIFYMMQVFEHGQSLAALSEEGELYIADNRSETWGKVENSGEEEIFEIYEYADMLCYDVNNTLYVYKGDVQGVELGYYKMGSSDFQFGKDKMLYMFDGNYDAGSYIYSFYENGSILMVDDYVDSQYGGTLYYVSDMGEKFKIADDVTSFVQLRSGTILYLSEQKLVCYSEGERNRIADDVRLVWSANEEKSVSVSQMGW
ncbi:hypothetical protein BRYFOR_09093 [Marvinbryantia formatexigens DSM 14469]|uniref:Uncharacterized protein n=1 Tax=Marvinbryantia formatexigens DSM 14469 TaxID=478749 RepID=C6LKA6_9FIRM|nr:hypothetical protein [Marvinbryantia formatexigens]EET58987.1 hypothetical protein BRYFOR_09093 [Marvinbryantia formatexigens DSM 14469]UWO23408.1 hypothetical protein NQ534_13215 [Marvinbryantia formatexigens DSM 14469]SDH26515.1 hypothetical protein SAMN05660368_04130 [Marvinbryantia formatexigens]